MGATVTYNGSVIAELNGGQTKKLKTAGTYLEGDLTVEATEVVDSPLPIEFSTEEEAAAIIESGEIGGVYKYTGTTTESYENGELYVLGEGTEADALQGTWVLKYGVEIPLTSIQTLVGTTFECSFTPIYTRSDGLKFTSGRTFTTFVTRSESIRTVLFGDLGESVTFYSNDSEAYGDLTSSYLFQGKKIGSSTVYRGDLPSDFPTALGLELHITILTPLADVENGDILLEFLQLIATKQSSTQLVKLINQTDLEELTVTENGDYTPSVGYSKVTVNIPSEEPVLEELTITENGEYTPSEGYDGFSKVTANVEGSGGGSAEFNIAYGDTEPTDTSKLWVKTSEPEAVQVVSKVEVTGEELLWGIATLPIPLSYGTASAVGKYIYLFGGQTSSGYSSAIYRFDAETEEITTLTATLPTAVSAAAAAAVGTKIYLFGGKYSSANRDCSNTINVFDTETNTITTLSAVLPTAAVYIGAAAVGTKIYLFGGSTGTSLLDEINVFDTVTNSVTTLSATLPRTDYSIMSAAIGTKIYLLGGGNSYAINVFDTENNEINTLDATLTVLPTYSTSAAVGTRIYLFGGTDDGIYDTITVFDSETNTVTTLSTVLPSAMCGIAAAAIGTKIYLLGGTTGSHLDSISVLIAGSSLATNTLLLEASLTDNIFNLLSNVEIGVKNVYLGNADGEAETVTAALYVDGAWTEI